MRACVACDPHAVTVPHVHVHVHAPPTVRAVGFE